MAILNYTTKISASKTVAEILDTLVKHGAREINQSYDNDGFLFAVAFRMTIANVPMPISFLLQPDFEGVLAAMQKAKAPKNLLTKDQAVRVAWRIEKDWLEAQMAKVEAGLASPAQLLLGYAVMADGGTVYKAISEGSGNKMSKLLM